MAASTPLPPARAISCGLDLVTHRGDDAGTGGPDRVILFVGRLEYEKHVDELVEAFAGLPAQTGARLEIIGMGSLRLSWRSRLIGWVSGRW